ncbi:hypothetical protein IL306_000104, partial [Fusarium sp. DS 682]
ISGASIVFTAGKLAHLPEERLFAIIGAPESTTLACAGGEPLCSSLPKQLVQKAGWDDWVDKDEEDIRLLDWGEPELMPLLPVIRGLMRFLPSNRISAAEARTLL